MRGTESAAAARKRHLRRYATSLLRKLDANSRCASCRLHAARLRLALHDAPARIAGAIDAAREHVGSGWSPPRDHE